MSIIDSLINFGVSSSNMRAQRDMMNYEKNLQQTIFEREDNAVQRRAADLEAAGLSKTLAAGGGAGAGQAINVTTPQMEQVKVNPMEAAIQMLQTSQTKAQTDLLRANKEKADQETAGIKLQNEILANESQYSSATLKWRIEQADYTTLTKWYETLKAETSRYAAAIGLQIAEYEAQIKALQLEIQAKYGLEEKAAQVMALQAAADYARHEADRYEDAGTVKGGVLPSALTSWLAEFNNLLLRMFGGGK